MKTAVINKYLSIAIFLCFFFTSCSKQNDWLDIKSNKSNVVPETLTDFQAVLDNTIIMNYSLYKTPGLQSADNFYMTDVNYAAAIEAERNLYTWNKQIWPGGSSQEWTSLYASIEVANVTLDGLQKITSGNANYNNVKGQALFHRAMAYYYLAQIFCPPYKSASATSDLGLPLRLNSDVNLLYQRSNLQDTYNQIIADATQAAELLPNQQPYIQRPINAAAYALLAKTYLNMDDYQKAGNYANMALTIHPALLDFNNTAAVSLSNTYRFLKYGVNNPEILFYAQGSYNSTSPWTSATGIVIPELYQSYDNSDLRKSLFYTLSGIDAKFRGAYSGSDSNFSGLATDEVYLIRAECYARNGNTDAAMTDLNTLLRNRFKTNQFTALTASNSENALTIILTERRKELPFVANLRWEDLRRLNKEVRFQKTLTRLVNGVTYTLPPNDKRYVLPIPDNEIQISNIQQNDR